MVGWNRKDWILLTLLTLLAAVLRLYGLASIPPGFQFDEAFNAIDAEQVLEGNRPLFLPANAGREALYTYWQALLVSLFGMSLHTLRLASAIFGIAAIPLTYALLRVMLSRDSRLVAFFTAITLAISLWHIHFSHYGIRVIMMPVLFSLSFGAFWYSSQPRKTNRKILGYIISGLILGISVWTHPTGRLAPFVVILYTSWLLWQDADSRRIRWSSPIVGLFLAGFTAFLVFLPLGIEFLRHPEFFLGHASEVSVFAERVGGDSPILALGDHTLRVLGMFAFVGDELWTHNYAGRPVFDVPMAIMFGLGLVIWASRIVQGARRANGERDADADALVLLAVWALIMLLPSVFSDSAPNFSRTLPALPALFVAAGLGLTRTFKVHWPIRTTGIILVSLILLYSGTRAVYDYFVDFPDQEDVYYLFDADKQDALEYLTQYTSDNSIYLSQIWGDYHATVAMLRHESGIQSLDTSDTIVLPPAGKGAIYAFPNEQWKRAEQLSELWPSVDVRVVDDRHNNPLLHLVEVPVELAHSIPSKYSDYSIAQAGFLGAPDLIGLYSEQPDKQITLIWDADEEMVASLTSFIHLIDPDGHRVAQIDKLPGNGSYLTSDWKIGETVIDRYYPVRTNDCIGGVPLRAQVGWYAVNEDHATRPRSDAAGNSAFAGMVTLPIFSHEPGMLHPEQPNPVAIDDSLKFLGSNIRNGELEAGTPIAIDLFWHSDHADGNSPVAANQPVTLSLQHDNTMIPIWSGSLAPAADWDPGEEICRRVYTQIPASVSPAHYDLVLDTASVVGIASQSINLTRIEVMPSSRTFELPALAEALDYTLLDTMTGDEISLLGVVTSSLDLVNRTLTVELAWQPKSSHQGDYRVFVHLLDSDGSIASQSDAQPGPDYPTTRWIADEVVVDRHVLQLPEDLVSGDFELYAGMYDPVSSQRLEALDTSGNRIPTNSIPLMSIDLPEQLD